MAKKTRSPIPAEDPTIPAGDQDPPESWSAQRKIELVHGLLHEEPLNEFSCESQVPAHELQVWHRRSL